MIVLLGFAALTGARTGRAAPDVTKSPPGGL
jgi:hypothetical protein